MALGPTLIAINTLHSNTIQSPSDWVTGWQTILDAGALDDTDNSGSPVLNPGGIADADHHLMEIRSGTYILLRMRYDNAMSALTTPPVIQIFGRYPKLGGGSTSPTYVWSRLYSIAATPLNELTFTPNFTNDLDDGTDAYTSLDIKTGTFVVDRAGCHSILAAVKTAATGNTGGSLATLTLQAAAI